MQTLKVRKIFNLAMLNIEEFTLVMTVISMQPLTAKKKLEQYVDKRLIK